MGKKERLQKELDLLLEKMRIWRYIILAIISGTIGILFSSVSGKLEINYGISFFIILGFIGIFISVKRLLLLDKNYRELLNELEEVY